MRSPRSSPGWRSCSAPAFLAATAAAELPTQDWTRTETRADCASYNPLRSPFFGETHIHTSFSGDAAFVRVRTTPRDAYRFALGEQIGPAPYDAMDVPTRFAQLHRPLDFTAVTDHSEFLGEIRTCLTPGLPGYDDQLCQDTRTEIASPPAGINAPIPLVVVAFQLTIQDANPMRLGLLRSRRRELHEPKRRWCGRTSSTPPRSSTTAPTRAGSRRFPRTSGPTT